ncbi:AraC family transcriptional regulator [Mesorhizobium retamae]|uniref:AraC family transcriptional regulator n=1 Tax=Mesorhizobium retamae TaxID=2912854 RepID=A0ABS9QJY3_9HYPH|nr:AraC family transcriptional regulator [Mesorhizobium sp. IRAMC:0171]MCG7507759.1 AraC family transcriptional regulator [Mesorhizobium sp. IRAMC:0171]
MNEPIVEVRKFSGEVEQHQHDYHQVILPVVGALEIDLGFNAGRVTGSIGLFVPAGCGHTFYSRQSNKFIVLDVPASFVARPGGEDTSPFFAIGPEVHGLIDYMAAFPSSLPPLAPLRQAWTTLLLDRIRDHRHYPDRTELIVRRAMAFMKRKLASPIRIADIAAAAGTSSTRLHDAFARRRATTPHGQLITMRLDAAERMLADSRLTIAEVAVRSGHADQSALTRIMRRERGTSPAALRKLLLGRTEGNA